MTAKFHPYFSLPPFAILGHRGTAGTQPENTLASFAEALKDGAHILESDVHLTADGEIIMMHDAEVDRTTNGKGLISNKTLAEMKALDAGYTYTNDNGKTHPFRGKSLKVPTLAEGLSAFPMARFNLDIKDDNEELVEKVVDMIAAAGCEERVLLTTEHAGAMKKLRAYTAETGSRVALGACRDEILAFFGTIGNDNPPPAGVMALQVPHRTTFNGTTFDVVTPAFIKKAHDHGIAVHVWTINDPVEMKELRDMGADGIFTDVPGVARRTFGLPLPLPKGIFFKGPQGPS